MADEPNAELDNLFDLIKSNTVVKKSGDDKSGPVKYFSSSDEDDNENCNENEVVKVNNFNENDKKPLIIMPDLDERDKEILESVKLDDSVPPPPVSAQDKKSVEKSIHAFNAILSNKRLLAQMKKCCVKLPKDKTGDLLTKIKNASIRKSNGKTLNRSKILKENTKFSSSFAAQNKNHVSSKADVFKTPTTKISFKRSILSGKRAQKSSLKRLSKTQLSFPNTVGKWLETELSHPKLVKQFGSRFFKCHVRLSRTKSTDLVLQSTSKTKRLANSLNKSVTFCDTVELLGGSSYEDSDESYEDINNMNDSPLNMKENEGVSKIFFSPSKMDNVKKDIFKQVNKIIPQQSDEVDNDDTDNGIKTNDRTTPSTSHILLNNVLKENAISTTDDNLEENKISRFDENTICTADDKLEESAISTADNKLKKNIISLGDNKQTENNPVVVNSITDKDSSKEDDIETISDTDKSKNMKSNLDEQMYRMETDDVDRLSEHNEVKCNEERNNEDKTDNVILENQNEMSVDKNESINKNVKSTTIQELLNREKNCKKDELNSNELEGCSNHDTKENAMDVVAEESSEVEDRGETVEETIRPDSNSLEGLELLETDSVNVSKLIEECYKGINVKTTDDFLEQMELEDESEEIPKDSLRCTDEDEIMNNLTESDEDKLDGTNFDEGNVKIRVQDSETDYSNESIANDSALETIINDASNTTTNNESIVGTNDVEQNSVAKPTRDFDSSDDDISTVLDTIDPI